MPLSSRLFGPERFPTAWDTTATAAANIWPYGTQNALLKLAENRWVRATFSRLPTVTGQPAILIGLNDRKQEGTFLTSRGDPARFYNWAGGEPNNGEQGGDEDAVQMYLANGTWNDIPRTESYPYIIEYEQSPLLAE